MMNSLVNTLKTSLILSTSLIFIASCSNTSSKYRPALPTVDKGSYKGYYKVGNPYQIKGKWYRPKEETQFQEIGVASWYGPNFHGKQTANGEIFDKHALTAAHRTLPMPSMIKVTNLENNNSLVLRVNDRGPFSKNRVLDVSQRAAQVLGFHKDGTTKVKIEYLPGHTNKMLSDLGIIKDRDPRYAANKIPESLDDLSITHNKKKNTPINIIKTTRRLANGFSSLKNSLTTLPSIVSTANAATATAANSSPAIAPTPNIPSVNFGSNNANKAVDLANIDPKAAYDPNAHSYKNTQGSPKSAIPNNSTPTAVVPPSNEFFIQTGAYTVRSNAEKEVTNLLKISNSQINATDINGQKFYRVQVGPINNKLSAEQTLERIKTAGYKNAVILAK